MATQTTELTGFDVSFRNIAEAAEPGCDIRCEWTSEASQGFSSTEHSCSGEVTFVGGNAVYFENDKGLYRLRKSSLDVVLGKKRDNGSWADIVSSHDSVVVG